MLINSFPLVSLKVPLPPPSQRKALSEPGGGGGETEVKEKKGLGFWFVNPRLGQGVGE